LAGDFERDFVEQIGLVFSLDCRGVAGAVNHSRENIEIVGGVNATAVAVTGTGALSREKKRAPEKFFREISAA